MSTITKSQFATTENVDNAKSGYGMLSSAATAIQNINDELETQCLRKVPRFVKVKDSLSENTTVNIEAFKSVCDNASSKIKDKISGSFENSEYYESAKKKDNDLADSRYKAALKRAETSNG